MLKVLAVFIGGGIGSTLRYMANCLIKSDAIYATLLVNFIGSLILGFVFYYFSERLQLPQELRLLLTVGFCGGLTTFSTFAQENYTLLSQGEFLKCGLYIGASVFISVAAVFLGVLIAKQF